MILFVNMAQSALGVSLHISLHKNMPVVINPNNICDLKLFVTIFKCIKIASKDLFTLIFNFRRIMP